MSGKVERQPSKIGPALKAALGIEKLETRVGWIDGARHINGTPIAYIAAIQEFGSSKNNIPPRSFMRSTVTEKRNEWAALAKSGAKSMLVGNATPMNVMDGLGQQAEGDIRKKISTIQQPPIEPATVKARQRKLADGKKVGSLTKPLVETGLMLTSLSSEVSQR